MRLAGEAAPDLILMDLQLPGHRRRRGAAPDPGERQEPRRPGRGGDRVRDERRPRPGVRVRLRRLRREADQRARPAPAGPRLPQTGRRDVNDATPTGARVLVVDDQPPNIRLLEAILDAAGVRRAHRRRPARRRWTRSPSTERRPRPARHRDAGHGRLRGVPARSASDPATAYLPVVMVTASGDEQKVKALEAGADDFLTKPINQQRAAGPGRLAGADQALPGHHQAAGRRARRLEQGAGVAGRDAGRAAGADGSAAAVPVPAARRADRRLRGRVVPREPPARDRRRLLRPPGLHRRSPRRASPRR